MCFLKVLDRDLIPEFVRFWEDIRNELDITEFDISSGSQVVFGDQSAEHFGGNRPDWMRLPDMDLAYHVAHFVLFLLIQGQMIVPLASDPFGFDWDLFGTANHRVNFMLVSSNFYWVISVFSILVGHIIAVFLSHTIAFRLIKSQRHAIRSQYPMLALMVGYTVASLWIITQPMYS